tara:strand:- start:59 stop:1033 length:975 start_codon:yes stop_codon:yes gene_type:complete
MENNSFKIGLLIQGPLLSIGRSGKSESLDRRGINSKNIISYDTRKSLDIILKKYSHLFDQIVISTWNDETYEYKKEKVEVYKFNKSKVPKLPRLKSISNFHLSQNNMLNQYYGSFLGIKKFRSDIKFIIKTRTDLIVNLQKIYDFMKFNYEDNTILIPKINNKGAYLEDYYFAGSKKIIKSFFESVTQKDNDGVRVYSESAHKNPLLKFAYFKARTKFPFKEKYFKKYGHGSLEQYFILSYIFYSYFRPLPIDIAKNVVWRGSKFDPKSNWALNYSDKFIFNFDEHYESKLWSTTKRIQPRIKNIIQKIITYIKNKFLGKIKRK